MTHPKQLLKTYAEIAYQQLHEYENDVNLQDTEEVEIAIFGSFIGQKISEIYKQILGLDVVITHKMNLWEGPDQAYVEIINEVIEEYHEH